MIQVKVLSDFSMSPGPRYCKQGPDSGELFYHKILNEKFAEAFQSNEFLSIDLDGTNGYMSSFLDEAIGNLVYDFGPDVVRKHLKIISNEEIIWKKLIEKNVIQEWTEHLEKREQPIKTKDHPAWYKLVNGELKKDVWVRHSA